jgi:oxalate decarboxylase/phosphoglucose isomerase-like protein (cupin superfamily)
LFQLEKSQPVGSESGSLYRASVHEFPELRGLAVQTIRLRPGGIRAPHIHPNAAQVDQGIRGRARVGIVRPGEQRELIDLGPGDLAFIPQGALHWIENIGDEDLQFTLILSHEAPQTIELTEMLAGVPEDVLARVLDVSEELLADLVGRLAGEPAIIAG